MRWELFVSVFVVLGSPALPTVAAQADVSEIEVDPRDDWRQLTTAGIVHDDPSPATLEIDGDQATLTTNPSADEQVASASVYDGDTDTFEVTWTKTNVDRYGNAFRVQVTGSSSVFGEVDLDGLWQANAAFAICTRDYPTSACNNYAAGPIELTGTVGDDAAEFTGEARDVYCTTGHSPLNQQTVCGEDTIVQDPCPECFKIAHPIPEISQS